MPFLRFVLFFSTFAVLASLLYLSLSIQLMMVYGFGYPIKTAVNKLSLNRVSSDTTIRFSQLGRKAASIGDCLLSRSKLLGLPL